MQDRGNNCLDDHQHFFDLTWTIKDSDSYIWFQRFDRLYVTLQPESFSDGHQQHYGLIIIFS
jgi:hypothetical protein